MFDFHEPKQKFMYYIFMCQHLGGLKSGYKVAYTTRPRAQRICVINLVPIGQKLFTVYGFACNYNIRNILLSDIIYSIIDDSGYKDFLFTEPLNF